MCPEAGERPICAATEAVESGAASANAVAFNPSLRVTLTSAPKRLTTTSTASTRGVYVTREVSLAVSTGRSIELSIEGDVPGCRNSARRDGRTRLSSTCVDSSLSRSLETPGTSPGDHPNLLFTAGRTDRGPKHKVFAREFVRPDVVRTDLHLHACCLECDASPCAHARRFPTCRSRRSTHCTRPESRWRMRSAASRVRRCSTWTPQPPDVGPA